MLTLHGQKPLRGTGSVTSAGYGQRGEEDAHDLSPP
jgi:hypothetical protein